MRTGIKPVVMKGSLVTRYSVSSFCQYVRFQGPLILPHQSLTQTLIFNPTKVLITTMVKSSKSKKSSKILKDSVPEDLQPEHDSASNTREDTSTATKQKLPSQKRKKSAKQSALGIALFLFLDYTLIFANHDVDTAGLQEQLKKLERENKRLKQLHSKGKLMFIALLCYEFLPLRLYVS
jgi:hypothetical protein